MDWELNRISIDGPCGDGLNVVTIEIGKLQLLPGDTLVIRCPEGWTAQNIQQFHEWLDASNVLPDGVKVLMLPEGADIGVLKPIPVFHCSTTTHRD